MLLLIIKYTSRMINVAVYFLYMRYKYCTYRVPRFIFGNIYMFKMCILTKKR